MGEKNELKNRYLHIRWKDNITRVSEVGWEESSEKLIKGSEKSRGSSEKSSEKSLVSSVKTAKKSEKKEKSSEKILALISENPTITTEVLAGRIGISTRAVEKHLANLKAKGLLLRIGPDKGGHWEVVGQ